MSRLMRIVLFWSYYYARFIGIITFAINFRKGRLRSSRGIIVYSLLANLLMIIKVPLLYDGDLIKFMSAKLRPLHMAMYLVNTCVRVFGMVISMMFTWQRRKTFLAELQSFIDLREQYFQRIEVPERLLHEFERKVILKIVITIALDWSIYLVEMDLFRNDWNASLVLCTSTLAVVGSYLNMMSNFYTCMQCLLHMHFEILNSEIRRIMIATHAMSEERRLRPRAGAFITMCCQYADELDALNVVHQKLRRFCRRLNDMFDVHGLCIIVNLFCNNISLFYLGYVLTKSKKDYFDLSTPGLVMLCTALIFYYWDLHMSVSGMNDLLVVVDETATRLRVHLRLPVLDERLEQSIEALQLNMLADPFEHNMRGFFKMTMPFCFSLFASTLSKSIILMQYDYKYY